MMRSSASRLVLLGSSIGLMIGAASCTTDPLSTSLRALESSDHMAFVCLGAPSDDANAAAMALSDCDSSRTSSASDYSVPHLYALVTQPNRGELAVVDMTTTTDAVIDQNPSVPGANFLHIGAKPGPMVATPGGIVTYVSNQAPGFEGLFAVPSALIRGASEDGIATSLSSWPACALPSRPEDVALVLDPADAQGGLRVSCEQPYQATLTSDNALGDLYLDASRSGAPGVHKLAVTLPDEGGIAFIDAQALLDIDPGAFVPCPIERFVKLPVSVPPSVPTPTEDDRGGSCAERTDPGSPEAIPANARPTHLTFDDGTLYVADGEASVIHRLDVSDPCAPVVRPSLIATSSDDPTRIVTTRQLALSPLTLDLKRYLYAIDDADGSVMVFDVSDDSDTRFPLKRALDNDPFGAADRIRFQAPIRRVVIVQHQNDETDSTTGATTPVLCDADPDSTGPGTAYQTSDNYGEGAGPQRLRGVFAFAVLTSGDVVVIDVEDYDAPCRGPAHPSAARGCANEGEALATSDEYSCNVVVSHRPRSSAYLAYVEDIVENMPGLTSLPLLFDDNGSLLQRDADDPFALPSMRAVIQGDGGDDPSLVVGSESRSLDPNTGLLLSTTNSTPETTENSLSVNLVEPRAHLLDQSWTVTYEGALPGFTNRFAQLSATEAGFELRDTTANFCSRGVMSRTAHAERLAHDGEDKSAADPLADALSDYVQIISAAPIESDPYWDKNVGCSFTECEQTYGTSESPLEARDLRITEAYQGLVSLAPRSSSAPSAPALRCCFPGVVQYRVRSGSQWTVIGDAVGFLHRVRADDRGVCRPACNAELAGLNGRALDTPAGSETSGPSVSPDAPTAFANPMFRFAIVSDASQRGMQFRFKTQGAFRPLTLSVVTSSSDVQPQQVAYLPATGELVVSDGTRNGLTLLDLDLLQVSRQYN